MNGSVARKSWLLAATLGAALCCSPANAAKVDDAAPPAAETTNPAIPEASTWMMLIAGMLGVGFAMRRRATEEDVRIRFE